MDFTLGTEYSTTESQAAPLVNRALQSLLPREWRHTIKCHFWKSTLLLLPARVRLAFDLTGKQGMEALATRVHLALSARTCSAPALAQMGSTENSQNWGNWREGSSVSCTFQVHRVPNHPIINYPTPASGGKLTNCISSDLLFHKKIIMPPGDADIAVSACSLQDYKGSTEKHF